MISINNREVKEGSIVYYKLAARLRPIRPDKLWRGRVLSLSLMGVYVEVLDEGYEGNREFVYLPQLVSVEYDDPEIKPPDP